jgi:lipoyl-dependent peroxiredoxin
LSRISVEYAWVIHSKYRQCGTGTNPEQLLAVGWSACFLSAMKIVVAKMKVRLPNDVSVDPEIDLGTTEGKYFIQARLNIFPPGIDQQAAQKIAEGAHLECQYA